MIEVIQKGDNVAAGKALTDFCVQYHPAIKAFILRRGYSPEAADDLVQEFFKTRILERWNDKDSFVHSALRGQGKFRCFLSQVVIRFLQDNTKATNAQKRGGKLQPVSVEALAETGQTLPGAVDSDCGQEFDLEYARFVIQLAAANLKHADHHLAVLSGKKPQSEVAEALGLTAGTFKVNHHRFRERFGQAIREVVKNAVGDDKDEVNEEIRYLMSLFERAL